VSDEDGKKKPEFERATVYLEQHHVYSAGHEFEPAADFLAVRIERVAQPPGAAR
jgi:hypothetical protein